MHLKHLDNCSQFIAGDSTHLRELLRPVNDDLKIRFGNAHAMVRGGGSSVQHKLRSTMVY